MCITWTVNLPNETQDFRGSKSCIRSHNEDIKALIKGRYILSVDGLAFHVKGALDQVDYKLDLSHLEEAFLQFSTDFMT